MLVFVKFLHFLGLMLGAGAGFGSMAVLRQMRRSAASPAPELIALRSVFARMALAGIVLLWLTGLYLYIDAYRGAALGPAFHAKLAVALLLLAVILTINIVASRAASAGRRPPSWLPKLGMSTPVLTLLAVALAAYVFS